MARLGSDPHSLTALGTGGAATRAGSGSPRPRAYRGQVEGHQGAKSASLSWVPPVLAALGLKEGGGFGKWTPVTGPMYGPHCQPLFFLVCCTLSDF